jgi:hypothetical protein
MSRRKRLLACDPPFQAGAPASDDSDAIVVRIKQ